MLCDDRVGAICDDLRGWKPEEECVGLCDDDFGAECVVLYEWELAEERVVPSW